jgi:hypothetical protein
MTSGSKAISVMVAAAKNNENNDGRTTIVSSAKMFVSGGRFCVGIEKFLANAPENMTMIAKFPVRESSTVPETVARTLGFSRITLLPGEYEPIERNVFALRADVSFGLTVAPSPVTAGRPSVVHFELLRDAAVSVIIHGSDGSVIRTLASKEQREAGSQPQYSWDGRAQNGSLVAAGTYTVSIQVKTRAGWFSEAKPISVVREAQALSANSAR